MTKYIANEAHFKEVLTLVPKVKSSLWIGTADIKDLYVEDRPFLGLLADLIKKGKEVRLIHAFFSSLTTAPPSARPTSPVPASA